MDNGWDTYGSICAEHEFVGGRPVRTIQLPQLLDCEDGLRRQSESPLLLEIVCESQQLIHYNLNVVWPLIQPLVEVRFTLDHLDASSNAFV